MSISCASNPGRELEWHIGADLRVLARRGVECGGRQGIARRGRVRSWGMDIDIMYQQGMISAMEYRMYKMQVDQQKNGFVNQLKKQVSALQKQNAPQEKTQSIQLLIERIQETTMDEFMSFSHLQQYPGLWLSGLNKCGALVSDGPVNGDLKWLRGGTEDWQANPTLLSADLPRDAQNGVVDGASVIHIFMSAATAERKSVVRDSWVKYARQAFLPIAQGLQRRMQDQSLSFELVAADMHAYARQKHQQQQQQQGELFDMIYMSNVPDYTGLLSCMIDFRALLRVNMMLHNNLYNANLWQSETQYIRSATRVRDLADLPSFLGFTKAKVAQSAEEDNQFIGWRRVSDDDGTNMATEANLRLWLEEVYLMVVAHPIAFESMDVPYCERMPLTTAMFFELLTALLERGYAPHLMSSILVPFLAGSPSTTTQVGLPRKSPYDFPSPGRVRADLSLYALEAHAVGAMWAEQHPTHMSIFCNALQKPMKFSRAVKATLHIPPTQGKQRVTNAEEKVRLVLGVGCFPQRGIVDAYYRNPRNGKMMLYPGSRLFSVTEWNADTQCVSFYVPEDAIEELRTTMAEVALYRCDAHMFMGAPTTPDKITFSSLN